MSSGIGPLGRRMVQCVARLAAVSLFAGCNEIAGIERGSDCGDGIVQGIEDCDDGNLDPTDDCTVECKFPRCGDGFVQVGVEECDDGNLDPTDACTSVCRPPRCGDGFVHAGVEECDDGNPNDDDDCLVGCVAATCGDGLVQVGVEECDDGNKDDSDACTTLCAPPKCGDGLVLAGVEECEDGNDSNSDACVAGCHAASCGDTHILAGVEECDDGNALATDACLPDCTQNPCGDGILDGATEECDDGGYAAGDRCDAYCKHERATQIDAGYGSTCALLADGRVKCWGDGLTGLLGQGDTENRGGQPGEMGANLPAIDFGLDAPITRMATGTSHACVLTTTGAVKCWGSNIWAELGLGDLISRGTQPGQMGAALPFVDLGTEEEVVSLAAGGIHTCALLAGGRVKCWGSNTYGELGTGDTASRGDQLADMGDALPVVDLGTGRKVISLAVGSEHNCAILDDGTVKCWGRNLFGRLGLGDTENRGDDPGEMGDALPTVDLGAGAPVAEIACGGPITCARRMDGSVKCWGGASDGNLGLGDTENRGDGPGEMGDALPEVDLGTAAHAVALAAGGDHVCALLDSGGVKCWGWNPNGELGQGDTGTRGDQPGELGDALPAVDLGAGRTAVALACGTFHVCALLDDGSIKCWGANFSGQLGQETLKKRGDEPGEMGDALAISRLFGSDW